MPYGPKWATVKCPGSGEIITSYDQLKTRSDLYKCPNCHGVIHRKADGTMPFHYMKQARW